jgi:hypothetical protein
MNAERKAASKERRRRERRKRNDTLISLSFFLFLSRVSMISTCNPLEYNSIYNYTDVRHLSALLRERERKETERKGGKATPLASFQVRTETPVAVHVPEIANSDDSKALQERALDMGCGCGCGLSGGGWRRHSY